ncbi:MAG: hypothetical protein WCV88_06260 [Patescibacteria group bacterium]|jgi:hypothetical protein
MKIVSKEIRGAFREADIPLKGRSEILRRYAEASQDEAALGLSISVSQEQINGVLRLLYADSDLPEPRRTDSGVVKDLAESIHELGEYRNNVELKPKDAQMLSVFIKLVEQAFYNGEIAQLLKKDLAFDGWREARPNIAALAYLVNRVAKLKADRRNHDKLVGFDERRLPHLIDTVSAYAGERFATLAPKGLMIMNGADFLGSGRLLPHAELKRFFERSRDFVLRASRELSSGANDLYLVKEHLVAAAAGAGANPDQPYSAERAYENFFYGFSNSESIKDGLGDTLSLGDLTAPENWDDPAHWVADLGFQKISFDPQSQPFTRGHQLAHFDPCQFGFAAMAVDYWTAQQQHS